MAAKSGPRGLRPSFAGLSSARANDGSYTTRWDTALKTVLSFVSERY